MKKKLFLFFVLMFLFTGFVYADYELYSYPYDYNVTGVAENGYIYMDVGESNKIEISMSKILNSDNNTYESVDILSCESSNVTTYLENGKCYLSADNATFFTVRIGYGEENFTEFEGEAGFKIDGVSIPKDGTIYVKDSSTYEINTDVNEIIHMCSYRDVDNYLYYSADNSEHSCTLNNLESIKRYEVEVNYTSGILKFIVDTGYDEYINYVINNKLHDVEIRYTDFIDYRNGTKSFGIPGVNFIGQCSVSDDLSFSCPISYYVYNKDIKDTFYGKLKGLVKNDILGYNQNEISINSTSYLSFYNYKSSDLYCFAEDTSIARVEDCVLTGLKEGRTNVIVFDRKSLDYLVIPYKVVNYQSVSYSSTEYNTFMEQFNGPVSVDLGKINHNISFFMGNISPNDVLDAYIRSVFPGSYVHGVNCEDGKCSFEIGITINDSYTTNSYGPFDFSYYGIKGYNPISLNVGNSYEFVQPFQIFSSDSSDEFVVSNYDSSMIEVDGNKITGLKMGITEVTITGTHSDYTASFDVNIAPKSEDISALSDYLYSSVRLEYNKDDFKDNLDVLSSIVENAKSNIPDDISYLNNYLKHSVECISSDICSLYYELNFFNTDNLYQYGTKNIKINYTGLDTGLSVLKSKLNKTNEVVVSFDDYVKYMYQCEGDSTCYYDKLKGLIDLSEFNKDDFNVSISSENYYDKPNSNVLGSFYEDVIISYKGSTLFAKRILVRVDNLLTFPRGTINKIEYIENKIKEVLNVLNVDVQLINNDTYNVIINGTSFKIWTSSIPDVKADNVYFSRQIAYLENIGDTYELSYEVNPSNYNVEPEIKFSVDDESIVIIEKVDDTNRFKITSTGKGIATITFDILNTRNYNQRQSVTVISGINPIDILNEMASVVPSTLGVDYSCVENGYNTLIGCISSAFYNNFNYTDTFKGNFLYNGKYIYGVQHNVYEDDGKYYFKMSINDYTQYPYELYSSDSKEITYKMVGITSSENIYNISKDEEIDTGLYFTEGSNKNLYARVEDESIASLDVVTGKLKGLKEGYTSIYVYDKKNYFYKNIKVYVDYEDIINNIKDRLANEVFVVRPSKYNPNISDIKLDDKWLYDYGIDIKRIDNCDLEEKICPVLFLIQDEDVLINVHYTEYGIDFVANEVKLEIDEEKQLDYISAPEDIKPVFVSTDESICTVSENGVVKGISKGYCVVYAYVENSVPVSLSIIVDHNSLVEDLDKVVDTLPDEIVLKNTKDQVYDYEENGIKDSYYAYFLNSIREQAGLDVNYGFNWGRSDSDDIYSIGLCYDESYSNVEKQIYSSASYCSTKYKQISLVYADEEPDDGGHLDEIISQIKQSYTLSLEEYFKYQLDGNEAGNSLVSIGYYSELAKMVSSYEGYSLLLDIRMGCVDGGDGYLYLMEGGNVLILYNDSVVYTSGDDFSDPITFEVTYEATESSATSQEEFMEELKEEVKEAYINAKSGKQVSTLFRSFSIRNNVASLNDDIEVIVTFAGMTENGSEKYNVDVEDQKIAIAVKRDDTSDYIQDITDIVLSNSSFELKKGETKNIEYTIKPSGADASDIVWKSNNINVVTVNNGFITAVGSGSTTIEVSTKDGSVKKSINIKVTSVVKGDVTGDSLININDLIAMRKHLAGSDILTGDSLEAFDMNGDGKNNINDVITMRKYLAK